MADRYLKHPDFWCELGFADSVKRALIRHFDTFLHQKIDDRRLSSRDPKLFNQDTIAGKAWDLADRVMDSVKEDFTDAWEVLVDRMFDGMQEWVVESLEAQITEVEHEFLEEELMGLDSLIEMASGTPIEISGTGKEIDFGMGPGDDD